MCLGKGNRDAHVKERNSTESTRDRECAVNESELLVQVDRERERVERE